MDKTEQIKICTGLTEEEQRVLLLFLLKADELWKKSENKAIHASVNIEGRINEPAFISVTLPDETQLSSFLMTFRLFYLKTEQIHFLKILNIVKRKTKRATAIKNLKDIKEIWTGVWASRHISHAVDGETLTPSLLMDLWFNANYFHLDEAKNQKLMKLNLFLSTDYCKALLINAVIDASKAVFTLAKWIDSWIVSSVRDAPTGNPT